MSHSCELVSLAVLVMALATCVPAQAAEASALLPHNLADVCPILPQPAPPGIAVNFLWPLRGSYVYSRDVQLQLQALDDQGSELPFTELVVTLHV
jgi:hypothetical protein